MTLSPITLLADKVQGPSQVSPAGLTFLIGILLCITIYGQTRERVSVPQEYLGRDRKSTRLNSSHITPSRMPSSA